MNEPLAYLNGNLVPHEQARLPIHDAGFVMGATVTDMCRTFNHRLFRWNEHQQRFRQSARLAGIPLLVYDGEVTRLAEYLVTYNASLLEPNADLALVLFATPGPIG